MKLNEIEQLEKLLIEEIKLRKTAEERVDQYIKEHGKLKEKFLIKNQKLSRDLDNSNSELRVYEKLISHDLKSPLRNISALLTWFKEDNKELLNNISFEKVDLIEKSLLKMDNLVSGMSIYSGVSTKFSTNKEVDLNDVLNDVLDSIEISKNLKIVKCNNLPKLKISKSDIFQLFVNILNNAINAIDNKEGEIILNVEEHKTKYIFSVKDNGVGIEEKISSVIFEPFQSYSGQEEFAGIGLFIVKKIVEKYGGDVWVSSEKSKGSIFYFTLLKT